MALVAEGQEMNLMLHGMDRTLTANHIIHVGRPLLSHGHFWGSPLVRPTTTAGGVITRVLGRLGAHWDRLGTLLGRSWRSLQEPLALQGTTLLTFGRLCSDLG